MRITLNLATRPFTDLAPIIKRLRNGMGILALVAVLLLLGLRVMHRKAEDARASEHSLDARIAQINQERQGYQALMQQPDNKQLLTQTDALNKLFYDKSFSWTLAMENLETVLPGGVQVVNIEPIRDKEGNITIHLRVVGPHDRSVELVRNLEHSRRFLQPRIVGENSEASNNPNQHLEPVSATNRFTFDLLADYNPPAPNEPRPISSSGKPSPEIRTDAAAQPSRALYVPKPQAARKPYTGPTHPPLTPNAMNGGPR